MSHPAGAPMAPTDQQPVVPPGYKLKRKKPIFKRVWFWLLAIIALIIIITVSTSGGGSTSANSSGGSSSNAGAGSVQAAGLNTAVRDGKFEFTVTGMDCSQNTLGTAPVSTKAQGVFCVVNLHVSNVGDKAQTFDASSQTAYDAQGRKFSADSGAVIYLGDQGHSFLEQMNPGSAVDGQLVYDVPVGTQLTQIELHDSMFSGGVKVNLQ